VILFARDWLHNNGGAFLEGTAPAVVASVVDPVTISNLAAFAAAGSKPTVVVVRPDAPSSSGPPQYHADLPQVPDAPGQSTMPVIPNPTRHSSP
jgi:hypothetical protein